MGSFFITIIFQSEFLPLKNENALAVVSHSKFKLSIGTQLVTNLLAGRRCNFRVQTITTYASKLLRLPKISS